MMSPIFVDTNIPMYAAGTSHLLREPSQRALRAIASGQLEAVTDVEVLQEILDRYLHIDEREKEFRVFDRFHRIMLGRILPAEDADVQRARELAEEYTFLSPRDLIHLAVMLRNGIHEILTADQEFDRVREVRRIDPIAFL